MLGNSFERNVGRNLGLNSEILRVDGPQVFAGNEIPSGAMQPAQAYAGHQFGHHESWR